MLSDNAWVPVFGTAALLAIATAAFWVTQEAPARPAANGCAYGPLITMPDYRQVYAGPEEQLKWLPFFRLGAAEAGYTGAGERYRVCTAIESTGWIRARLWVQLHPADEPVDPERTAGHWVPSGLPSLAAFVERYGAEAE